MASSRVVSRASSSLQSLALKLSKQSLPIELSSLKSTSLPHIFATSRRLFRNSRLPVECCCLGPMMPLHDAIASARLVSSLPVESPGWGLVPQGISMPL